ncbi:TauD/TfdA family dioxygenase [Dactylosporangium sp. McL0621]|uniref:TauD/TfdA family dioxygenase n=1 Tax=Dactylosporangium sp. McL0621 TaxID=3415678 RepID=UPI003CE8D540
MTAAQDAAVSGEGTSAETGRGPAVVRVERPDAAAVRELAGRVIAGAAGRPLDTQLRRVAVLCHELPLALREALVGLRLADDTSGGLVVSGLAVHETDLCPTPATGRREDRLPGQDGYDPELALADATLLLITSFLGDPISHADIEGGRLIRDVCAKRGDETQQLATGSRGELTYHCEDAYHDLRADWVLLLCLRNPERAATSFANIDDIELDSEVRSLLFEEKFSIDLDSSHQPGRLRPPTRQIAVLSGDPAQPFVCLDPEYMTKDLADGAARRALETIEGAVQQGLHDVVLETGDLFVIDNLRSVHGRRSFRARYDEKGRWLRTVHAAADLRRSAGQRTGSHGRAVLAHL